MYSVHQSPEHHDQEFCHILTLNDPFSTTLLSLTLQTPEIPKGSEEGLL